MTELKAGRGAAVSDLRDALMRNLGKALANRPGVDEAFLEDAVQDSVMRILDRIDQFEGRSKFLTWATSVAIHRALAEMRRIRWRDVSLDELVSNADFVPLRSVDHNSRPPDYLERQALLAVLQQLIENDLTEKQRRALVAELKGMPLAEIARHLRSNRNAIYKLTHDARRKLKAGLEAAGYTAEYIAMTTAT